MDHNSNSQQFDDRTWRWRWRRPQPFPGTREVEAVQISNQLENDWLQSFYKECGREITLAYTTLNQVKTWAMVLVGGAISGMAFSNRAGPLLNEQTLVAFVVIYVLVLRFFVRSILCYINLKRWNALQRSCIETKLISEAENLNLIDPAALKRDIRNYYLTWLSPISRSDQLKDNLTLGFHLLLLLPFLFVCWGLYGLWDYAIVRGFGTFAVCVTFVEFIDFRVSRTFDDVEARGKRNAFNKRKTPSERGRALRKYRYLSSWVLAIAVSIAVGVFASPASPPLPSRLGGVPSLKTIFVTSSPSGAKLSIFAMPLATTPSTLFIPSGAHSLRISLGGNIVEVPLAEPIPRELTITFDKR